MQQYAEMLLVWERYNDAVDVCDAILKLDRTYYPAYLVHQKACFELGKAQEVVNDYQMAVSIVNNYYRPYLYAALVYYYYGQYQAGADVLKEARENNVEFPCSMMLVDEKIQRRLAEDKKKREKLHAQLEEIAKSWIRRNWKKVRTNLPLMKFTAKEPICIGMIMILKMPFYG